MKKQLRSGPRRDGQFWFDSLRGVRSLYRRCICMAKCDFCGKEVTFGIKVSHSHRRSNRTWKPNVRRVKAIVNGTPKRVHACTRCLRSGKVTRAVWSSLLFVVPAFFVFCFTHYTHCTALLSNAYSGCFAKWRQRNGCIFFGTVLTDGGNP